MIHSLDTFYAVFYATDSNFPCAILRLAGSVNDYRPCQSAYLVSDTSRIISAKEPTTADDFGSRARHMSNRRGAALHSCSRRD